GKVPALRHDETLVYETTAIALYLADAFPASGLGPKIGDSLRGPFLSWLSYYGAVFEPSLTAKFLKLQHLSAPSASVPFQPGPQQRVVLAGKDLQCRRYRLWWKPSAADVSWHGSRDRHVQRLRRARHRPSFPCARASAGQRITRQRGWTWVRSSI